MTTLIVCCTLVILCVLITGTRSVNRNINEMYAALKRREQESFERLTTIFFHALTRAHADFKNVPGGTPSLYHLVWFGWVEKGLERVQALTNVLALDLPHDSSRYGLEELIVATDELLGAIEGLKRLIAMAATVDERQNALEVIRDRMARFKSAAGSVPSHFAR